MCLARRDFGQQEEISQVATERPGGLGRRGRAAHRDRTGAWTRGRASRGNPGEVHAGEVTGRCWGGIYGVAGRGGPKPYSAPMRTATESRVTGASRRRWTRRSGAARSRGLPPTGRKVLAVSCTGRCFGGAERRGGQERSFPGGTPHLRPLPGAALEAWEPVSKVRVQAAGQ